MLSNEDIAALITARVRGVDPTASVEVTGEEDVYQVRILIDGQQIMLFEFDRDSSYVSSLARRVAMIVGGAKR